MTGSAVTLRQPRPSSGASAWWPTCAPGCCANGWRCSRSPGRRERQDAPGAGSRRGGAAGFAHGVEIVDLSPLRDPRLVVSSIARPLGVPEGAPDTQRADPAGPARPADPGGAGQLRAGARGGAGGGRAARPLPRAAAPGDQPGPAAAALGARAAGAPWRSRTDGGSRLLTAWRGCRRWRCSSSGRGRAERLPAHRGERPRRGRDLRPPGRAAPGPGAGGGALQGAPAPGAAGPPGAPPGGADRRRARSPRPAPEPRRRHRLESRSARRCGAHALQAPVRLRRGLHRRDGRGRGWGNQGPPTRPWSRWWT